MPLIITLLCHRAKNKFTINSPITQDMILNDMILNGGRKRKMTDNKIESAKKLLATGTPPRDVAKNLGISIPTLYRWIPASSQA